jgi:hypothetical protein
MVITDGRTYQPVGGRIAVKDFGKACSKDCGETTDITKQKLKQYKSFEFNKLVRAVFYCHPDMLKLKMLTQILPIYQMALTAWMVACYRSVIQITKVSP